jgi:hypothetical protein
VHLLGAGFERRKQIDVLKVVVLLHESFGKEGRERTQLPPSSGEVREDATHRFAFECLNECFTTSPGACSLGIRPGSLPRDAICRSLKGKSSIGFDVEK